MEMTQMIEYVSPFGPLVITVEGEKVNSLYFKNTDPRAAKCTHEVVLTVEKNAIISHIEEYFSGSKDTFKVDVPTCGTNFQEKVWIEISKIPYGETRTYSNIATAIGHPKAVRAVGTATGLNPLCILIPCHRVIRSDGKNGQYAGGELIKNNLLKLERDNSNSDL